MTRPCKACGANDRYEISGKCRPCSLAQSARWLEANPEKRKVACAKWRKNNRGYSAEAQRKWRKTAYGQAFNLVKAAGYRCEKKKLPFDLTPEDILPQIELGVCEVTGISFATSGTPSMRGPFVASLDRKVAALGYTKGNVQVVIWALNAMRGNWGDEILLQVAKALTNRR